MNDRFIIVASGPTARGFKPPDWAQAICVNQSIDFMPRCDHWFTLDPSAANLQTMHDRKPGVKYWMAVDTGWWSCVKDRSIVPDYVNILTRVRQAHPRPQRRDNVMYNIHRLQCRFGLDERDGYISTGNSAWGALGLAYQLRAAKVLLVGVDATSDPKLDGTHCRTSMEHLPLLFESAVHQIDMASASKMKVSGAPHLTIEKGLEWLRQ